MNLADLSIRRPIFISCLVIVMLVLGWVSLNKLSVELFPDVSPPVVSVVTMYPGTGPKEIETLVTKPIEDGVSTIAGSKRVTSQSLEGVSQVVIEFYMDTDIKRAEQMVRDKVSEAKVRFPTDVKEPIVQALSFSDQAVITVALKSDLSQAALFDLADRDIKPRLQQLKDVGKVSILGGRKREIQVLLDRTKLKQRGLSAGYIASQLAASGANIPAGKIDEGTEESVFRSKGEFRVLTDIETSMISLFGNENATRVKDVGSVVDTLEDEKNKVYVDGKGSIIVEIYKQSKTNTVALAERVRKELPKLQESLKALDASLDITLIRDGSREVSLNILDVKESIFLGIILTIFVVFLFLGNFRSTIITGLALPNSLLGSFILMQAFGLSINIVTLLALSLVVGLLIDDAIVVRENIFRFIEKGFSPREAASKGTAEVTLAVVATTLVVMSVFGPIALTEGLVGRILANFGLTMVFAMAISLFDALTVAPMLSAYFAGATHKSESTSIWSKLYGLTFGLLASTFDRFQSFLEHLYAQLIVMVLRARLLTFLVTSGICFLCFSTLGKISKTFIPAQDAGEFSVVLELPQGTNLPRTNSVSLEIDKIIRSFPEIATVALTVGGKNAEPNEANFYIRLKSVSERSRGLSAIKDDLREKLKPYAFATPKVQDYDFTGGGMLRPVTLNLLSDETEVLETFATKLIDHLKNDKRLKDVDTTMREGKKEFSFELDPVKARDYGLNTRLLGSELRAQVQGVPATVFRESGNEYDVRVMMKKEERNIRQDSGSVYVMNLNNRLIRLSDVAMVKETRAQASIDRQNRTRYIQISADLAPNVGIGDITNDFAKLFADGEFKLPPGVRYALVGESENFEELATSLGFVLTLAITFIYLVLSSLYESFVTPITVIVTLPLALCGAFVALYATSESINLFSGLGMLMLMGVSCKNSILLIDFCNQKVREGIPLKEAIVDAGRTRLRPILMTSFALIAGTIPIAVGLNEASQQRVSMGIAIIGGVISSTILSLIVVPAILPTVFYFSGLVDRMTRWVGGRSKEKKID